MKNVFITGATAGFGEAMAHLFAEKGCNVVITGRRNDRLQKLEESIIRKYGVKVQSLCFDVRNRKEVEQIIESISEEMKPIDVLINNAGLASGKDALHEADPDDWEKMIDTNVKGLLYVSRAILPAMVQHQNGHVINIGSIAGKETYAGGSVYCASKHAVDALSKAMRIDLVQYGIRVTQVSPGAAETEFSMVRFKGNEDSASKVYEGYDPLTAWDIAEIAWFAASRPPHVCLNDIVVTPTAQANSVTLFRNLKS